MMSFGNIMLCEDDIWKYYYLMWQWYFEILCYMAMMFGILINLVGRKGCSVFHY